jgi:ubiquinone biosynthesis protein COQ4
MQADDYAYSAEPTRNPFRYARAVWRLVFRDPEETTPEAALVEMGFARSKLGRRFARWEATVDLLEREPGTADAMRERRAFGPIELEPLAALPEGTLGRVFADHCGARGINPNLVQVPPTDRVGWMLNHLYQTHDIWHVVTGWGNDLAGEVGLAAFYCAQLRSPAFFGYMLALISLNVVARRGDLDAILSAFSTGYRGGKSARPMFGTHWDDLWALPFDEVRARFEIDRTAVVGEGVLAAA